MHIVDLLASVGWTKYGMYNLSWGVCRYGAVCGRRIGGDMEQSEDYMTMGSRMIGIMIVTWPFHCRVF